MAKVKIRTGRGTNTIEVDNDPANWSGDEFKKIQAARKRNAENTTVVSGRGTGSKRLKDIPEPQKRPTYKGHVSSGRGTGTHDAKKK